MFNFVSLMSASGAAALIVITWTVPPTELYLFGRASADFSDKNVRMGCTMSLLMFSSLLFFLCRRRTSKLICRIRFLPHTGDLQISMLGFQSEWVEFMSVNKFATMLAPHAPRNDLRLLPVADEKAERWIDLRDEDGKMLYKFDLRSDLFSRERLRATLGSLQMTNYERMQNSRKTKTKYSSARAVTSNIGKFANDQLRTDAEFKKNKNKIFIC